MVESSEDSNIVESISDEIPTCPMCGEPVSADAIECPNCEEPFSPEAFEAKEPNKEKSSKRLFWLGLILVLVGGPGVALGSWLHDLLEIPVGGNAFSIFGQLNQMVSLVGIIILVVGIILLILSLPKLHPDDDDEEETSKDKIITGDQGG